MSEEKTEFVDGLMIANGGDGSLCLKAGTKVIPLECLDISLREEIYGARLVVELRFEADPSVVQGVELSKVRVS